MFLLRSAFWLTLAFIVMRPGVDVGDAASQLSQDAMQQGSRFVAQQIDAIDCHDFTCAGGKALVSAALQTAPQAGAPMHVQPAAPSVPLPRPRPDIAG